MYMTCVSSKSSLAAPPPLVEAVFTAKRSSIHHHIHKRDYSTTTTNFAVGTCSLNPFHPMDAAAAAHPVLYNSVLGNNTARLFMRLRARATNTLNYYNSRRCLEVHASQGPGSPSPRRQRGPPGVDTRIHWDNQDEGWIGGTNTADKEEHNNPKNLLGENFANLLNASSGSHYEFIGVSAEADLEEIKAAYRRLSKEYHPDTTSLPLKTASEKFMKLREIYDVLSKEETRKFYDWTLAQEAASRQAEKMKMRLEDPYEQDVKNWEPVPDMVDRLGGRNMKLSDQATSALTIDIFIVIFSICCIIYVIFFKEPYY